MTRIRWIVIGIVSAIAAALAYQAWYDGWLDVVGWYVARPGIGTPACPEPPKSVFFRSLPRAISGGRHYGDRRDGFVADVEFVGGIRDAVNAKILKVISHGPPRPLPGDLVGKTLYVQTTCARPLRPGQHGLVAGTLWAEHLLLVGEIPTLHLTPSEWSRCSSLQEIFPARVPTDIRPVFVASREGSPAWYSVRSGIVAKLRIVRRQTLEQSALVHVIEVVDYKPPSNSHPGIPFFDVRSIVGKTMPMTATCGDWANAPEIGIAPVTLNDEQSLARYLSRESTLSEGTDSNRNQ